MSRSKKLTIAILLILTLVLAGAAFAVSLTLRQDDVGVADPGTCPIPGQWKNAGDACNLAVCGNNACDGDGPLECRVCTLASGIPGLKLRKETQNICMDATNVTAQENACGGICCDDASKCGNAGFPLCSDPGTGGGTNNGGGDGTSSPGLDQFSCNADKVCTLANGLIPVNEEGEILNCNVQTGYVHYCPDGFSNGRCITPNPTVISLNLTGGQTVDVKPYLNKGCGAYQVDFQPPGYPNYSGACGAKLYEVVGNCTPDDSNEIPEGPSGDGSDNNRLSVTGRVVCRSSDTVVYPVEGVTIRATYTEGGQEKTIDVVTNANGNYVVPYEAGQAVRQRFNLEIVNVPSNRQLSNGAPYTQMVGPLAVNCADTSKIACIDSTTGNYCNNTGPNNSSGYNLCRLLANPTNPIYNSFRFEFSNCGVITTQPRCGDAQCTAGELCEATDIDASGFKLCSTGASVAYCRGINDSNTPACTFCGDGIVQTSAGEECDPNANGETPATCNNQCKRITTEPPRCGDAICTTGELCEVTTPGGNEFKKCVGVGTITQCRGLGGNTETPACTFCGDGIVQTSAGEECDPEAPGDQGRNCDITCKRVTAACQGITRIGPNPIQNGVGNTQQYTVVYRNASTSNPYPNIKLVVGTPGTPVGRDYNNKQNATVSPVSASFDSAQSTWTYRFIWEAATTANADVPTPPNSYPVVVLPDGTTPETASACATSLEFNETAQQEPLFTIIKEAAPVCVDDGSAEISYTIRVQNVGPVSGVIDFVEDTIDPRLVSANITPTDINPNYGVYNAGKIRWEGTEAQRTFAANETKQYTFRMRIPADRMSTFASTSLVNQVQVTYDTPTQDNNTSSFTLNTPITCSTPTTPQPGTSTGKVPTTPSTALFGDSSQYILIAMLFILTALIMYKYGIGNQLAKRFIDGAFYGSPIATYEQKLEHDAKKKIEDKQER